MRNYNVGQIVKTVGGEIATITTPRQAGTYLAQSLTTGRELQLYTWDIKCRVARVEKWEEQPEPVEVITQALAKYLVARAAVEYGLCASARYGHWYGYAPGYRITIRRNFAESTTERFYTEADCTEYLDTLLTVVPN